MQAHASLILLHEEWLLGKLTCRLTDDEMLNVVTVNVQQLDSVSSCAEDVREGFRIKAVYPLQEPLVLIHFPGILICYSVFVHFVDPGALPVLQQQDVVSRTHKKSSRVTFQHGGDTLLLDHNRLLLIN